MGRALAAISLLARHPKRAYRALYAATRTEAPPQPSVSDRFTAAMSLLTGLDVAVTFERDGLVWTVPPGQDGIAEHLFASGSYAGDTIDAVQELVRACRPGCDWIVDVGANIGTTTIPLAAAGFRVLAVEPVPTTLAFLQRNVEANGLQDRVRVLDAAVSTDDRVTIAVSTSLGSSEVVASSASVPVFERRYGPPAQTIEARALTLDDAVASVGVTPESIGLVWSDTQGSDTAVIETGASLWKAGVPLLAEFWPDGLAEKGGVQRFIEHAGMHFQGFLDAAHGGRAIRDALSVRARTGGGLALRPIPELRDVAADVVHGAGRFTDVLLLP